MRKALLTIAFFSTVIHFALCQPYGNEWINQNLPHYAFKVAENKLCRISRAAMENAGMQPTSLIGSHFRIHRNGKEIPIYVTTDDLFGENDYIEFVGDRNKGDIDTELFPQPSFHANPNVSLFTDTATYYLVIDPQGQHLRLVDQANNLTNLPAREEFFYHTARVDRSIAFNQGENPNQTLNFLFDSNFDVGEGFMEGSFNGPSGGRTVTVPTAFRYTTNNLPSFVSGALVYINNSTRHEVNLLVANRLIRTFQSSRAGLEFFNEEVPVNNLATTNTAVRFNALIPNERSSVFFVQIRYPRLFNFGGASIFNFGVNKTQGAYVEISNYNAQSTVPLLIDIKNKKRYAGIIENNLLKYNLVDESLPKDSLFLTSQSPIDILQISELRRVQLKDPTNTANHGNYVIITHKSLVNDGQGNDYVKAFADYRQSASGGNHKVVTYFIDELEDMFAWGVRLHPLAIRNFINYAVDNFSIKPQQVFIIGKGLGYHRTRNNLAILPNSLIQTYGEPASDMLLTTRSVSNPTPQVAIGRLSAAKPNDINVYLQKVKEYEALQNSNAPTDQTLENKEWMKNILHLGGGNFLDEQTTFRFYLENYRQIIEGPFYGGKVSSVFKNSTEPVQIAQSFFLDSMINKGLSLITFFGHSSTTTVDFNIEPENFTNGNGRYPMMMTNGCFVGNIFENFNSYSERFVLLPGKASIGYIAPMTLAVAFSLNQYAINFYNRLGVTNYGSGIGSIMRNTASDLTSSFLASDRILAQQMIYHGDPAIKLHSFAKPDYILTEENVLFEPSDINASTDSFSIKVISQNVGKAVATPYTVTVERTLPGGEIESYEVVKNAAYFADTIVFRIKTDNLIGLGQNSFKIKLDSDEEIDEFSELNNEVTIGRFFITDNLIPVYPPKFGIVNTNRPVLSYSTANPFMEERQYILQLDTTELFNSPILLTAKVTQSGGIINWSTNASLMPGKVYYWRGSMDSLYGNPLSWNKSSFLYNPDLSEGWNQSHYFQFLPNSYNTMMLAGDRRFKYIDNIRTIKVINGTDALGANSRVLFLDNSLIARNAFDRRGFLFFVLDTKTGIPMSTYQIGLTGFGEYGNVIRTLLTDVKIIEFNTTEQRGRYSCYFFIKNAIPDQAIVCGYSFNNPEYTEWASDDSVVFNGQTLFDAFESIGVTQIRGLTENKPFVFFTQKGNPSFEVIQVEAERSEIIDTSFTFSGTWNAGSMISPIIGPSGGWNTIDYNFTSLENPSTDKVDFDLIGYSVNGERTKLLNGFSKNVDISSVDADVYPFLQMEMRTEDKSNSSAPQLDYWRVIYEEVPEAAINPQRAFTKGADTVSLGDTYKCAVAFENITDKGMDSILVKFTMKDASNRREMFYKRFAPLPGKQFIVIDFEYTFSSETNQGMNTIIFEANPDNDQKEQLHFNNFAFFNVFVSRDRVNPLMDVTFDGRHITDGEIVSPTPEILIRLKDENKFLALNDTSAFRIFVKSPNASTFAELDPRSPVFNFIPATQAQAQNNENEARLYFRPDLPEDGIYELRVQAADRSRNDAGKNEYRVRFTVDRRPAISNVLNYPNPFSTSTQFVFTLTGSDVPTDIKIQIMTVTGKVVKEITAEELGDIRIGNNITSYRWDGTDNYGDRLANGLYLYRVVAKMNGQNMEMLSTGADRFFNKGFGKMYIVR